MAAADTQSKIKNKKDKLRPSTLKLPEVMREDPKTELNNMKIVSILQQMNKPQINKLFEEINTDTITKINYALIGDYSGRKIIYVISFNRNTDEIPINMFFYSSSGISREGTDIKDYIFPCTGFSEAIREIKIDKLEDEYIHKYIREESSDVRDMKEEEELLKYGRFINLNNTIVGKILYQNREKIFSDAQILPVDKINLNIRKILKIKIINHIPMIEVFGIMGMIFTELILTPPSLGGMIKYKFKLNF